MEINEKFLKLSSRVPFPREIKLGQDLTVLIEGEPYIFNCVSSQDKDLQDGTIDRIYTLKSLLE
jgi:hypothetical protein